MHFLLVEAILEDIFSDLVKKNPSQEQNLTIAKSRGVAPKYFAWLVKILNKTQEPLEDIIPVILAFDKKQPQLKAKFGGSVADINSYKTVQELSNKLEELEKTSTAGPKSEVLYDDGEWEVVFPRNTQESCADGAGTTWCTARTQSQNLFLSYVGRNQGIVLYYIIKKGGNPRANPKDKLSVGFINGKIQPGAQFGGITVDAANEPVKEEDFQAILGPERWAKIQSLLSQHNKKLGGKHPAEKEMQDLAQNAELLNKKLNSFKKFEELRDFIELISGQSTLSEESVNVILNFANNFKGEKFDDIISDIVQNNENLSDNILLKLLKQYGRLVYYYMYKKRPFSDEVLSFILEQGYEENEDKLIEFLNKSDVGPLAIRSFWKLVQLHGSYYDMLPYYVLSNQKFTPDLIQEAINTQNRPFTRSIVHGLLDNPNITRENILELANNTDLFHNTYFFILAKYVPDDIKINLMQNKGLPYFVTNLQPEEVDEKFSDDFLHYLGTNQKDPTIRNWANGQIQRRMQQNLFH